jgi:beta-phosphoglucomutase-like phosphatase (HAD superfamily)
MTFGLVFDCDGVLADTETLIARATVKMFRDLYGIEMKPEAYAKYIGTGPIRYVEGPAADHGVALRSLEEALEVRQNNFMAFLESGEYIGFSGTNALIESAAADVNWMLAIATSSVRHKSEESLKAARVPYQLFDAYISGDMVTRQKPFPDIYLKAADALGLPPASCVAIEDSVAGIQAAKSAGMKCVAVTNTFPASMLGHADRIVDSLECVALDELKRLFEIPVNA